MRFADPVVASSAVQNRIKSAALFWTCDDQLRQPVSLGLRTDNEAAEVSAISASKETKEVAEMESLPVAPLKIRIPLATFELW